MNRLQNKTRYDAGEAPKWKRIPLPEGLFEASHLHVAQVVRADSERGSIEVYDLDVAEREGLIQSEWQLENHSKSHLGERFLEYINGHYHTGHFIVGKGREVEEAKRDVVYLTTEAALKGASSLASNLILVRSGCALTVVMDYRSIGDVHENKKEVKSDDEIQSKVKRDTEIQTDSQEAIKNKTLAVNRFVVEAGARLKLFKLQRFDASMDVVDQTLIELEDGAESEIIDAQLGGTFRGINYTTNLKGRHSRATLQGLYLGGDAERMDLSYTMRHLGGLSESLIEAKGALSGNAKKIFRGNLIFETGSAQSVGREHEAVMLLDETVRSESIPALLCSEDDVIGEHAASVGRIDQDRLFYLMSRGMTHEAAKKLVVKAAFEEVLKASEPFNLRASLETIIDRRLV